MAASRRTRRLTAEEETMTTLLPELRSVHLREAPGELVVEVEVPVEIDPARISTSLARGVLQIRLPRVQRSPRRLAGFHPDASGV
jgi:HSP20 family molecular chaperone IbpA